MAAAVGSILQAANAKPLAKDGYQPLARRAETLREALIDGQAILDAVDEGDVFRRRRLDHECAEHLGNRILPAVDMIGLEEITEPALMGLELFAGISRYGFAAALLRHQFAGHRFRQS